MATEWFYTTNKQQMGPVSWHELRELAEGGILKPHDLVWSEGMDEWVKAITQQGLFADDEGGGIQPSRRKAGYKETAKPPPGRRTGRRDDDDDEEEDSKEAKRKARKKQQDNAKMAVGLKVTLILGGVVVVLMFLGCIGAVGLYFAFSGGAPRGPVRDNYTVFNLGQGQTNSRQYNFTHGRRVTITVTNNLAHPMTDVDLHVFQGNDPRPFIVDVRTPPAHRNCRVDFDVPATGNYRVEIANLGPGMANSCVVNVEER